MKYFILYIVLTLGYITQAQERRLQIEPNHSTIGFSVDIAGFSEVTGKFTDFEVYVNWNDTKRLPTYLEAQIQASSVNTGIEGRDTHLRTADFFDVEKYPTITFKSDSIVRSNFSKFMAHGSFTMHGVTKKVALPFIIVKQDGNTIGFRSETSINRLDYGVASDFKHTSMPGFLSEQIAIHIAFWTKKRKEQ